MQSLRKLAVRFNSTKIGNWLHLALMKFRSRDLRPKVPQFLHVETTSICNAKCVMCAYPQMERPNQTMEDKLFDKIVEESAKIGVEWVNLQFYGEPLVDKKIYKRIRELKEKGKKVKLNTNASLLNEKNATALLETEIDQVNVSFDAFSREMFNKIRIGLDYDKVMENIERLFRIRNEMKSETQIMMTYVCLESNKDEAILFRKKWEGVADKVLISFARDWAGKMEVKGEKPLLPVKNNVCKSLWNDLIVLQDGKVALCCQDYEGQGNMGDLNHQSLEEVWNGDKFVHYRKFHQEGKRHELDLCKTCDYYSFWWK